MGGRGTRVRRNTTNDDRTDITREQLKKREEDHLGVVDIPGKGRGVLAARPFFKNQILCQYIGERVTLEESRERLSNLTEKQGCYILDFEGGRKSFSLDATKNDGRKGRLVNHSCTPNCKAEIRIIDNVQRVVLFAKQTIVIGEEITYDYGDRDKESLEANPWLADASR